ncbi:CD99 antigen isoform X2 [Amia ocellicauda]|uniref:CD99 antigen isoform X2 n=1 Tax=Amia ocellicauda TaxID=2972642 RepID=UPI00346425FC
MLFLRIVFLASLTGAALAQDFHLGDALDDFGGPTKPPTPKPKPPQNPGGGTFDLGDAFGGPATTKPPPPPPKKPAGDDFSLDDALGGGSDPYKPPVKPPKDSGTGGGSFGDDDLFNAAGGEYTPDKGHGGAGAGDSTHGGAEEPQEAGSSKIAGIVSAVGVALLGAASSYFAYQKKKLCFKVSGGADPESGNKTQAGTHSEPQVLSNLLRTS